MVMSRLPPGAARPPSHGQACAGAAGTDSQSQPGASFPSSELTGICEELEFHLGGRIYTTAIARHYRLRPYLPLFPSQGLLTARGCLLGPLEDFFPAGRGESCPWRAASIPACLRTGQGHIPLKNALRGGS